MTITLQLWMLPVAAIVGIGIWCFTSSKDYFELGFNLAIFSGACIAIVLIWLAYYAGTKA